MAAGALAALPLLADAMAVNPPRQPTAFAGPVATGGMASEPCDACGADVPIGGGISGFWSSEPQQTGGMTLELTDGTEHFLCFACIERLPDDPSADDVRALEEEPPETEPLDDDPLTDAADEPVGDGVGDEGVESDGDG